jgi:hypothetical protein
MGDQVKKDEMSGTYSTHGKNLQDVYWEDSTIMSHGRPSPGLEHIEMRFRENGFCVNHNKYSMREKTNAYRILVGNPEGKRPLEMPNRSGRIILKWILKIGWHGMDWIHLAQDRDKWRALVITAMNLWVP